MAGRRRALIVGAGVAGMSAAIRLEEAGWEPVIVERKPSRRMAGYMVGMFAEGVVAAERLGVRDDIGSRDRPDRVTLQLDADGTRRPGPGLADQPGAPEAVLRSDIEAALWKRMGDRIEVRFGLEPVGVDQDADAAHVTLRTVATGATHRESFDLVVGADGVRSAVRTLVLDPEGRSVKPMPAVVCAFQARGQMPGFAEHESVIVSEPRRAMWVFALAGTTPTVMMSYRTRKAGKELRGSAADAMRRAFTGLSAGGVVEDALRELDAAEVTLFDSVEQIRLPSWHRGRVVVIGDAAWCLTLFSGMGATSGLLGGAALGDALAAHPDDIEAALTAFEAEMRPFVVKHQRTAAIKSQLFVPSGRITWWIRRRLLASKRFRVMGVGAPREPKGKAAVAPAPAASAAPAAPEKETATAA
ncbi:FAD-dependent monooxygenase [Clavibacter sp. CFBP 8614]|uniref:FAD-dependent monooxygenase n=1 Tax=unclassified Clavibacter TaxID=2626594 RepID=UPI004043649B